MENRKKTIVLSVVAIATLIILVMGATFAYFQAQTGASKSTDVNVTTYTTDVLTFTTGDDINIALTQSDFASGKGNAVGNTFAKASLTANNKTNTSTKNYYVYLNIENNSFTYSIDENTPELILTITDPDGTEVTSLEGLTYKEVTDGKNQVIKGFDVTTKKGVITIANNKEITASPSKEEQYTIKLIFVNYNANQNGNAGAGLSVKLQIQKEVIPLHKKCDNNTLACYVAKLYTETQGKNNIYYHNGTITTDDGMVIDAKDNSYRYAGASENVNNFVCFGSDATPCTTDNLYRIIGVFGDQVKLIKYDYATGTLLGTDGDYSEYTYSKSSYSTYKGELTTINTYYWNYNADTSNYNNTWSTSLLNKTNLNKNFITNIGTEWAQKIAETTWKVGGNTYAKIETSPMYTVYQNEIIKPEPGSTSTTGEINYKAQIGLMYISDYGYAASSMYWTYPGFNGDFDDGSSDYRAAITSNWMYMGLYEWTISRYADYPSSAFDVYDTGRVNGNYVYSHFGVRPSFSLKSSITYKSGSGTSSDPIRIN